MKKNGKDLNPYESLDEVLNFFAVSPFAKQYNSLDLIIQALKEKSSVEVSPDELLNILNQLIEDGFVKSELSDSILKYFITFKGQMLNLKGGYDHTSRDQERLYKLEMSQRETSRKTYTVLVILAIGAVIATIYYLIRLYNLFSAGH